MFSKKIKNTLLLQSHVATGSQTGQIKIKIKKKLKLEPCKLLQITDHF